MESASPIGIGCTCYECVFNRWFPDAKINTDQNTVDVNEELVPAEVWSLEQNQNVAPLPEVTSWPEAPIVIPQCAQTVASKILPDGLTPGTSSTLRTPSKPSAVKLFRTTGLLPKPFVDIPVKVPSISARRQRRTASDMTRESPAPSCRLHVSNVPFWFQDLHLIELFQQYGNPRQAEIIYNERGSKGFGFVTFESVEEAKAIRKMFDGMELFGRVIEVNFASRRTNRKKHQPPPDMGNGFLPLVLDPEANCCKMDIHRNICIKHKPNRNQTQSKKCNGTSSGEAPIAPQNGRNNEAKPKDDHFQTLPGIDIDARNSPRTTKCEEPTVKTVSGPSDSSGTPQRGPSSDMKTGHQDTHVIQERNFINQENNYNEYIESLQGREILKVGSESGHDGFRKKAPTGTSGPVWQELSVEEPNLSRRFSRMNVRQHQEVGQTVPRFFQESDIKQRNDSSDYHPGPSENQGFPKSLANNHRPDPREQKDVYPDLLPGFMSRQPVPKSPHPDPNDRNTFSKMLPNPAQPTNMGDIYRKSYLSAPLADPNEDALFLNLNFSWFASVGRQGLQSENV